MLQKLHVIMIGLARLCCHCWSPQINESSMLTGLSQHTATWQLVPSLWLADLVRPTEFSHRWTRWTQPSDLDCLSAITTAGATSCTAVKGCVPLGRRISRSVMGFWANAYSGNVGLTLFRNRGELSATFLCFMVRRRTFYIVRPANHHISIITISKI